MNCSKSSASWIFAPGGMTDVRAGIRQLLARAFSQDLRYLGAYRAWQEAALSDPDLSREQERIHAWTTTRVKTVFNSCNNCLVHGQGWTLLAWRA